MQKRCITAKSAPPPLGPYSHAVAAGNLLFMSGQISLGPDGHPQHGTIEEETRLVLTNIKNILDECGSSLSNVVKCTCFLDDINDFQAFNGVYKEFFTSDYPARTTFQAGRLPGGFKVEIEVIAVLSQ